MVFGDIYRFRSSKAKGYASRNKFHVYISEPGWNHDHLLLFISKRDYVGDYEIRRDPNHRFLTEATSFISFGSTIEEPEVHPADRVGVLDPATFTAFEAKANASDLLNDFRAEVLKAIHSAVTQQANAAFITQAAACASAEDEDALMD